MAIKTISQFPPETPTSNDKILFEQNGEGKSASIQNLILNTVYPVGSIYLSLQDISPSSFIGGSSWEKLPEGKALWTASSGLSITDDSVNLIGAGLPNITGYVRNVDGYGLYSSVGGAFSKDPSSVASFQPISSRAGSPQITIDASRSSSIYGNSDTVQPPAYKVYAWKRIA